MLKKEKGKKETVKKESAIVSKESICATCAVFCLLAFLILCTRSLIFGSVGTSVHVFLTGTFGYLAYPIVLAALYLSVTSLIGKRLVKNRRLGTSIVLTVLFIALIVQTAMTYSWETEGYLRRCFLAGTNFPDTTACGLLGGLIVLGVVALTTKLGALVFFSVVTAFSLCVCYLLARKAPVEKEQTGIEEVVEPLAEAAYAQEPTMHNVQAEELQEPNAYGMPNVRQRPGVSLVAEKPQMETSTSGQGFSPFALPNTSEPSSPEMPKDSRAFLFGGTPAENYQRNLIFNPNARVNQRPNAGETSAPEMTSSYTPSYSGAYESALNMEDPPRPTKVVNDYTSATPRYAEPEQTIEPPQPTYQPVESYLDYSDNSSERLEETDERESFLSNTRETINQTPVEEVENTREEGYKRHDYMELFSPSNPRLFGENDETPELRGGYEERGRDSYEERGGEAFSPEERREGINLLDDEDDDPYTLRSDYDERSTFQPSVEETRGRGEEIFEERGRGIEEDVRGGRGFEEPAKEVVPAPPKPVEPPKPRVIKPYKRVPLDDFDCRDIEPTANQEEVEYTKDNILATLEEFKITGATIDSVSFGPTVTRYNVAIPRNISPKKVVALDQSIAISLHSNGVNIYPNYEDGVVSIEVPNKERQFVQLGCMLSGDTFVNAKSSSIMFAMGKDVANRKIYGDISKMIHLLVAGSSGSGKSVFLGSLIISLIYKYSPEELRLILIDPKKTEFVLYNNLPHLMINEIITDAGKAVQSLNWAIGEMNRRYGLFEQMSRAGTYVVNLDQYNAQLEKSERLPKIVIIIDELADLMLAAKKEMEDRIQNLTQKARAAGIHLIVATQRPSTDVITGVIKSNLATRVAFYVATDVDSRVILDQSGAQKLLGKGDFLYTMPGVNVPVRVQSAFISPEDSQKVVNFIKNNNEAYYDEEATAYINSRGGNGGTPSDPFDAGGGSGDNVDPMYIDALRYVILSNSASISMIQRKCSAGYNRAGKIIEWMEDMGYISPFDGAKARKVLITKEEFESKYGPLER